ncbi:MAG TPA: YbjN domain-containing protein [Caulobacteraceae bacterium]|jgi:hypothetical protein|nr:YbjN domain-containing protein [Caulobacteraceae bacterium]
MKVRRLGLALSAFWCVAGVVRPAVAQTAEPIDHWNTNAVMAAVQVLKAENIQAVTSGGRAAITARTHDGLNVGIYAKACDPGPPGVEPICHGMEALISFDPGARADRKALVDRLNHQFALGKFMDEPDGSIRLSSYLVFDGGVTPGNLRAQLASLFAIGALTTQTLWPTTAAR